MQGARKSSAAFPPQLMLPWVMWRFLHPTGELGALALYFVAASLCFAKISHGIRSLHSGTAEDKLVSSYKTGLPLQCVLPWFFCLFFLRLFLNQKY